MADIKWDSVESWTPWEQGVRFGWSAIIMKCRINPKVGELVPYYVGGMQLVWVNEDGTGEVLNQVVSQRCETSRDVGTDVSVVLSDDAGTYGHFAFFDKKLGNPYTTTNVRCITKHGTVEEHDLDRGSMKADRHNIGDVDTTATRRRDARDGAVDEGERATALINVTRLIGDATTGICRIARDGAVGQGEPTIIGDAAAGAIAASHSVARDDAVGQGEHGLSSVLDATAVDSRRIARDGAVRERECPLVVDAAAGICRIARDGAVGQGEPTIIGDAAARASRRVARDGAVGQHERPSIVDKAVGGFAVLEDKTGGSPSSRSCRAAAA